MESLAKPVKYIEFVEEDTGRTFRHYQDQSEIHIPSVGDIVDFAPYIWSKYRIQEREWQRDGCVIIKMIKLDT